MLRLRAGKYTAVAAEKLILGVSGQPLEMTVRCNDRVIIADWPGDDGRDGRNPDRTNEPLLLPATLGQIPIHY